MGTLPPTYLPTYHRIRSVEFIDKLPKNNYGKIL